MRYPIVILLFCFLPASAQIIVFTDASLKFKLVNSSCIDTDGNNTPDSDADTNNDGEIQLAEAATVTNLHLMGLSVNMPSDIENMAGLEHFTSLEKLLIHYNKLTEIDIEIPSLKELHCDGNLITNISLAGLPGLQHLNCAMNPMESLDVSGHQALEYIQSYECPLANVNLLDCPQLRDIDFSHCNLTGINLDGLTSLERIFLGNNPLNSLDISTLSSLNYLLCSQTDLSYLDASALPNLEYLYIGYCNLTSLNVSGCTGLKTLDCTDNLLTSLDLSHGLSSLTELFCGDNYLSEVDLSNTPASYFWFNNNPDLHYINIRNNVTTPCGGTPGTEHYTCPMFMGLPSLQTVCVDDAELEFGNYYAHAPQENVQFVTDCPTMGSTAFETAAIAVYPNPVPSTLFFESASPVMSVTVYNNLGQAILFHSAENIRSIDLASLRGGLYIVQIVTQNGPSAQKIIKQ